MRVIVYEMSNGKTEVFEIDSLEMEQHERAEADRALHDPKTGVIGYHFEDRDARAEYSDALRKLKWD